MKRNVHTAILKAAANGTGIRLTAEDVRTLALDSAVKEAGLNTLDDAVRERIESQANGGYLNPEAWKGVQPVRPNLRLRAAVADARRAALLEAAQMVRNDCAYTEWNEEGRALAEQIEARAQSIPKPPKGP